MGALGGPPEEIGHKVAAALVGTFLGILLCYGLVGPLAANMAKAAEEERALLARSARSDDLLSQRQRAHHGGRVWAPSHPRPFTAFVPGSGENLPWRSERPKRRPHKARGQTHGINPPIIIKKKVVHGGHHGGAWKVAYADFVTAMMALFIVLWLMNSSRQVQEAIGGYFKDPSGKSKMVGTDQTGSGDNFTLTKENMAKLKEQLQKSVRKLNDFDKLRNQIEMTVTAEGLRIELLESASGTFFESGSTAPNDKGKELLALLARNWASFPTRSRLKDTPIRSLIPVPWRMETGNFPPIAPMPPGD